MGLDWDVEIFVIFCADNWNINFFCGWAGYSLYQILESAGKNETRIFKRPFTHLIFDAIFVALSNATFVASVN